jgi:hypothetical protein
MTLSAKINKELLNRLEVKKMTKTFCNKCGKELKFGDHRKKEIIGEEEYTNMIKREAEHKQAVEERRKKRESENEQTV